MNKTLLLVAALAITGPAGAGPGMVPCRRLERRSFVVERFHRPRRLGLRWRGFLERHGAIAAVRLRAAAARGARPGPAATRSMAARATITADTTAPTMRRPSSIPTAPVATIAAAGTPAARWLRDSSPAPRSAPQRPAPTARLLQCRCRGGRRSGGQSPGDALRRPCRPAAPIARRPASPTTAARMGLWFVPASWRQRRLLPGRRGALSLSGVPKSRTALSLSSAGPRGGRRTPIDVRDMTADVTLRAGSGGPRAATRPSACPGASWDWSWPR